MGFGPPVELQPANPENTVDYNPAGTAVVLNVDDGKLTKNFLEVASFSPAGAKSVYIDFGQIFNPPTNGTLQWYLAYTMSGPYAAYNATVPEILRRSSGPNGVVSTPAGLSNFRTTPLSSSIGVSEAVNIPAFSRSVDKVKIFARLAVGSDAALADKLWVAVRLNDSPVNIVEVTGGDASAANQTLQIAQETATAAGIAAAAASRPGAVVNALINAPSGDTLYHVLVRAVTAARFGMRVHATAADPTTPLWARLSVVPTAALTGTLVFTTGSADVTGVGTAFLTELAANSWIYRTVDSVWVQVDHVVDDANLVLKAVYPAAGGAAAAAWKANGGRLGIVWDLQWSFEGQTWWNLAAGDTITGYGDAPAGTRVGIQSLD